MPQALAAEEPIFDPAGPFRIGEGFADTPASCDTLENWIAHAPTYDGRFSMTVVGPVVSSHWDGALAFLTMCDPSGPQVICVTYAPHKVDPETPVLLAGGYQQVDEKVVLLDPCLAYDR